MKVLHVIHNYYPAFGGPQYTMKHLSEKMIEWYNDEVEVATSNSLYGPEMPLFKKIDPAVEVINKVKVQRYSFNRWHYQPLDLANRISKKLFRKPFPFSLMKKKWGLDCPGIDKAMKKTEAEVIMATTLNYNFCDYPFWRFKTKNPKPFVVYGSLHLHINWSVDHPFIERARQCDCYIANTDFELQKLVGFGVNKNKIVTIGTGIDVNALGCEADVVADFRKTYNIQADDVLIGHIGRLSKGKGTNILLNAFSEQYKKNKKLKLLLAGTSTEFVAELKQQIQQQQLPVILLEDFSDELKPLLFNAIDVFVLASQGESFGVVFLEAWACKKPVIGSNTGAVASLISNNVDGFVFEPNNSLALSEKLETLCSNEIIRRNFGEAGCRKVQDKYTWNVIVRRYREAYRLGIENFKSLQGYPA